VACAGGPTIEKSAPIPTCDALPLDPGVERIICPVLLSFLQGSHEELETALEKLLASRDSPAVEAQNAEERTRIRNDG
jgi:hypothetical protein